MDRPKGMVQLPMQLTAMHFIEDCNVVQAHKIDGARFKGAHGRLDASGPVKERARYTLQTPTPWSSRINSLTQFVNFERA